MKNKIISLILSLLSIIFTGAATAIADDSDDKLKLETDSSQKKIEFKIENNTWDVLLGSGIGLPYYDSTDPDYHGSSGSSYIWMKFKVRPLIFNILDGLNFQIGVFFSPAFGGENLGENLTYGRYTWERFIGGLNIKFSGNHWDTDFEWGLGWKQNNSHNAKYLYKSKQEDNFEYYSWHAEIRPREFFGKWLTKTAFDFEYMFSYSTYIEAFWANTPILNPPPYSMSRIEFAIEQGICDITFENFRITPGLKFNIGQDYGENQMFIYMGPSISLSVGKQDIFNISGLYQFYVPKTDFKNHWTIIFFVDVTRLGRLFSSIQKKEEPACSINTQK